MYYNQKPNKVQKVIHYHYHYDKSDFINHSSNFIPQRPEYY